MNKKGQGLPLNTVIVAILVIVVLVLVLTFFFGGFTGLSMKIRQIFFGGLAGTSETLAIQNCNQYCSQLQLRSDLGAGKEKVEADQARKEMFAKTSFCRCMALDTNEDGKADKNVRCTENPLNVYCSYTISTGSSVRVTCPEEDCPSLTE